MTMPVPYPRTLLLMLMLAGVALLLALTSGPAEAATAFTVNDGGDARDRKIDGVCDALPLEGQQCTLRAAIQEANATANSTGPDEINFAIGGTAPVKSINVGGSGLGALPTITESVTINGYSQGSQTSDTSDDARPNSKVSGSDAIIKVRLNGTNAGATANGLRITASDTTIKGLAINRFARNGILVVGSGATGNKVEGNFIGTNASGTQDLGNARNGVRISGAPGNTIGGIISQRNLLSGNDGDGVEISGSGATGNKVENNHIGTTADGTQALGNTVDGVYINGAENTTVGTGTWLSFGGNIISGNGNNGVEISGSGATGNRVAHNYIGITPWYVALGNASDGVLLSSGAHDNVIGGISAEGLATNQRIAFNGGDGVRVSSDASTGNTISANATYENGGLGINLSGGSEDSFGVTANDVDPSGSSDDSDTGPNDLQNYPVIESVVDDREPGCLDADVAFRLDSTPNQTFEIQFFATDISGFDPPLHGEGGKPLERRTVTTDASGTAFYVAYINIIGVSSLTATATNTATGDTSEFSENAPVICS